MVDDKIASCGVGSIILSHYAILKQYFQYLIQHLTYFILKITSKSGSSEWF